MCIDGGVGSGLKGWDCVDFGGVLVGRAWVLSLPKFFLGKYFHFWKLPPYFCINSRGNVYYPVFLTCYLVRKTNIKYTVICIVGVCRSVKIVSEVGGFALGKACEGVRSFLNFSHLPQHQPKPKPTLLNQPTYYNQPTHYNNTNNNLYTCTNTNTYQPTCKALLLLVTSDYI